MTALKDEDEKVVQVLVTLRRGQKKQIDEERKLDINFNFSKFVRYSWDEYMGFRDKGKEIVGGVGGEHEKN
jgi:hypothetical protein